MNNAKSNKNNNINRNCNHINNPSSSRNKPKHKGNSEKQKNKNNSRSSNSIRGNAKNNIMVAKRISEFSMCRISARDMCCGIPDGCNGQHIVTSLYQSDTISYTGNIMYLQLNPWLPSPILLHTPNTTGLFINGIAPINGSTNGNGGGGGWYHPLGCARSMQKFCPGGKLDGTIAAPVFSGGFSADVYNAATARIVGIRFRITNITAPMFRSGMIQAFNNNITINEAISKTNVSTAPPPGSDALVLPRSDGTPISCPAGIPFYYAEGDLTTTLPQSAVTTHDMVKPLDLYLKHNSPTYKTCVWNNMNYGLTNVNNTILAGGVASTNLMMSAVTNNTPSSCINLFDNDFDGTGVILSGLSTTQSNSISIETFITVEIRPSASSSVMSFSKPPMPLKQHELDQANAIQKITPIMRQFDPRK